MRVSGCDPSSASIQRANERNRIHVGFAGTFQIEDLPTDLHDGAADLVFLTEVIEHLDDEMLEKVLRECNRILIPGGRLVISTPNEENLDREKTMCPECGCTFHRWQHQRKWSEASLSDCLKQVGFPHIRIEKVTWGNELINFLFTCTGKKKSGLLAIAQKSGDKRTLLPPAHT